MTLPGSDEAKAVRAELTARLYGLYVIIDPEVTGGQYYGPSSRSEYAGPPVLVRSTPESHDEAIARRLWTVSEQLTGVPYPV